MAARDRIARGESPEEAANEARREFGNRALVKEVTRDMWAGVWIERLVQDVRYAVRSLSRVPGFTAVAVLTLALGIGANSAIFSVVNGVLLKPLSFPEPGRLVYITSQVPAQGFDQFPLDPTEYAELRERNHSFEEVGAYVVGAVNIGSEGPPARVVAAYTTATLLPTLGVQPLLGRFFTKAETMPGASDVGILSYELWESAFAKQQSVLGQSVDIDGAKTTIIGVMPADFDVHDQKVKIWLPLTLDPSKREQQRAGHYLLLVGRLKRGITIESARTELQSLLTQWQTASGGVTNPVPNAPGALHTPDPKKHRLRYDDLRADMVGSVAKALWVLQAAVGLVLLIACANMANLLLMRAESRRAELTLRIALGAGRFRLMRQFLVESMVLSIAGAAAGLLLARWGLKALVAANAGIPRVATIGLDGSVLLFTLFLAVGTGLVFGLTPLRLVSVGNIGLALRSTARRATTGAGGRVRGALVVAEVALAVILVVGAGLLMRSFWNLLRVDTGFDRAKLTTFGIVLPPKLYAENRRRVGLFDDLTQRLAAIPGVQSAAAMSGLPPQRQVNANDIAIEDYVPTADTPPLNVDYYQYITPNYLSTMAIPIVAGRSFNSADAAGSAPVAMINETLVRIFFPKQDPIGHRVQPGGSKSWFTIIGVVKDVKQGGVDSKTGTELYLDYEQAPTNFNATPRNMNVVLRSSLPTASLAAGIRRAVTALDATLPIVKLRSMDEVFSDSVSRPHFLAELLGIFAGVALALAAIGTYGVLAYSVNERRREIGIRMALGATEHGLLSMVLGQGMTLAGVGLVAGLVGAFGATRLASSLLFNVKPADPTTFISVAAFMLIVAFIACVLPARRATRVDPLVALRSD